MRSELMAAHNPCSVPDVPSAVLLVCQWCIANGHHTLNVQVRASDAFSVSCDGPGLACSALQSCWSDGQIKAVEALARSVRVRSRSRDELQTHVAVDGSVSLCADARRSPGMDIIVDGMFHAGHVRKPVQCVPPTCGTSAASSL